jgi:hypothetical protein
MRHNYAMAMHLDFVDLRLFVNIAETNSLTRAADRSHMCLSAASISFHWATVCLLLYHALNMQPPAMLGRSCLFKNDERRNEHKRNAWPNRHMAVDVPKGSRGSPGKV